MLLKASLVLDVKWSEPVGFQSPCFRLRDVEQSVAAPGPRSVRPTNMNLGGDLRMLFRSAAEEHAELENDVVKVFFHLSSTFDDGEVEDDRVRSRLYRDTVKMWPDESQRRLTCLIEQIVPPQQDALFGRRDVRVVVLPGGVIHARKVPTSTARPYVEAF